MELVNMYIHYQPSIRGRAKVEELRILLCQPQKNVSAIVTSCFIRLIQSR